MLWMQVLTPPVPCCVGTSVFVARPCKATAHLSAKTLFSDNSSTKGFGFKGPEYKSMS